MIPYIWVDMDKTHSEEDSSTERVGNSQTTFIFFAAFTNLREHRTCIEEAIQARDQERKW